MVKTKKAIWIGLTLIIISVFSIFIYATNGDWLPNNGAIITSAAIVSRNTGTAPFDDNNEPGNDSGAENNIVRSFDQITWTLENTMAINNTGDQYYTGGTIYFEASVPANLSDIVKWNTDSMNWIEDLEISDDATTITGSYTMPTEDSTVPGKQTLVFVLDVLGAKNGTQIQPTFKTWLNGNSASQRVTTIDSDIITVSAAPAYNIEVTKNPLNRDTYMEDPNNPGTELYGKVFGYGIVLSLNNTSSEDKGLKGTEYPTGDITFDLDLGLSRYGSSNEDDNGDLTDIVCPLLYQYCVDGEEDNLAYNDGREFFSFYGGSNYNYPYANRDYYTESDELDISNSVYKSGKYSIVQDGDCLHVTLKDYAFDGYFPKVYSYMELEDDIQYPDGRGNFSVLPLQIFIPMSEETEKDGLYYVEVMAENLNATSISGIQTTEQTIKEDDESIYEFMFYQRGDFSVIHQILDKDTEDYLHSSWQNGDGVAYPGQSIRLQTDLVQSQNNSPTYDRVEDQNILFKFDAECYEPEEDGEPWTYFGGDGEEFKFNVYYAAKKNGENWSSEQEQNEAVIEDLKYYRSLEELYSDGNNYCVGVLLESYTGWEANFPDQSWNNDTIVNIPVRVKETAEVGKTYSFTTDYRTYNVDLDRSVDSVMAEGFDGYSIDKMVDVKWGDYIKTEYDSYGQIIEGTHDNIYLGNTLLIVDAKSSITIGVVPDENGNEKLNYDYGKNEYDVNYVLTPSITPYPSIKDEKETTIYVEADLDYRASYVPGSCNYGDPTVITTNEYGDTVLIWEVNDVIVGKVIEPLTFTAHMSEEIENGEQLSAFAAIFAPEVDMRDKWLREDSVTVEIINLASHRLYKTTDTPVIEQNGEIHYTVSYKNNTDNEIPDFQLLDILPYNGDLRGSNFTGTYKLDRIEVTQWDKEGNELEDNNNLIIKYTDDDGVREEANVKDDNFAENWNEVDSYVINDYVTALAIIGNMDRQQKLVLDIYLKTDGNNGEDVYYNDSTARVYTDTEEMTTPAVRSSVVERKISGYAWLDNNKNGIIDEDESFLSNVEMVLTDSEGNSVIDVNGNEIGSILTDTNGYYEFDLLPEGEYIVGVVVDSTKYTLTEKEVGNNIEVNSKFNLDTQKTDIITKLNETTLPVMKEEYQNVGLVTSSGNIKVLHVLEGTDVSNPENITDVLYKTEIYSGEIGQDYTTVDRLNEINSDSSIKYELVSWTDNYVGKYTENTQYIIYYYNVLGNITLTKVDFNDNTIKLEGAKYRLEKLDGLGNVDSTFTAIELDTNKDGVATFEDLSAGKYILTEIKAPENYEISKENIEVEINKDNTNIQLNVTNKHKIELPETGGIGFSMFITIGIIIMSTAVVLKKIEKI